MRLHVANQYDFLAITDHRFYNFKNYAPDTDIVIIPGMEMDYNLPAPGPWCRHCYHILCLGPTEGNGYAQDERFESLKVNNAQECQPYLDEIHARNNLTIYAHPEWSSTPVEEFRDLQGNFAMEIWNSGCVMETDCDKDAAYWDVLLREGRRIYGVATDDGHDMKQHCNGWVMVNAQKNVPAILNALRDGAFYSSTGPEIYDFYVDGGQAVVRCSPARRVRFHYGYSPTRIVDAAEEPLTGATNPVPEYYNYIRASVIDAQGHTAWTNPIFLKD